MYCRLLYTWTQLEGPSLDFTALTGTSGPRLTIPSNVLEFGSEYTLKVRFRRYRKTLPVTKDTGG